MPLNTNCIRSIAKLLGNKEEIDMKKRHHQRIG